MTLIAVLLAIVTERYWHPWSSINIFAPLTALRNRLIPPSQSKQLLNGSSGLILILLPPVGVIAALQFLLSYTDGLLTGLLALIFSVMVLAACVGDHRFGIHVKRYIQAVSDGQMGTAAAYLEGVTGRSYCDSDLRQLNKELLGLMLLRQNERVLTVLFWFVILGPMGAVLYRSVSQLMGAGVRDSIDIPEHSGNDQAGFQDAARRLKGIMDWLPARLTALCYALIGSFVDALHVWWQDPQRPDDDWVAANDRLLIDVGIGALQLRKYYIDADAAVETEMACTHVREVRKLARRTLLAGLTILAALTITGQLI